jgi:secondary thiamine-phosphate synthase enzyme
MEVIDLRSNNRIELINITPKIKETIKRLDWNNGLLVVYVPHTTAGIIINEGADPDVGKDVTKAFNELIPLENKYLHLEGNSAAHIKASITGGSQTIIIEQSELMLGTWQAVFLAEFDGPRHREVYLKFIPAAHLPSG